MTKGPVVIESESVSSAWVLAFSEIADAPKHEIAPLIVCVTGFDENVVREDPRIRALLDAELRGHGMQSIRTVASTIFPSSLWNPNNPPQDLFDRYPIRVDTMHARMITQDDELFLLVEYKRLARAIRKPRTKPKNRSPSE